jgi:hypothetical protein
VLSTETGAQVSMLVGVIDSYLGLETNLHGQGNTSCNFRQKEDLGGSVENVSPRSLSRHVINRQYEKEASIDATIKAGGDAGHSKTQSASSLPRTGRMLSSSTLELGAAADLGPELRNRRPTTLALVA